jgi:exopolyphosphatase/guanosine-5'-triphosphate,3'-diphosphate pyrophosphatase
MEKKVAIIDLGSNSVRMNIYSINQNGGYGVWEQAKEMVRLSEGLDIDGLLKEEPILRTIKALTYFKNLLDANGVKIVYAVSTAAVRIAKNKDEFLQRVKKETGFIFNTISGIEEAYYDYISVINSIPENNMVIMDIGGASTEIILVKNRKLINSTSLPFGSVNLTEHFKTIDVQRKQVESALLFVKKAIDEIEWLKDVTDTKIVGIGGITRSLGKIDLRSKGLTIENLHNYSMSNIRISELMALIESTPLDKLSKIDGVNKKRADLMHVGLLPLKTVLNKIGAKEVVISTNGLRDGLFYSKFHHELNMPIVVNNVIEHSKTNLMKKYSINQIHARRIESIAIKFYDALYDTNQDKDRKILGTAACLHDIGMHIDYYNHHMHGMNLIMNIQIDGINYLDQYELAFLIANHREEEFKDRFNYFESLLDRKRIQELQRLAVILQISELIDKSENGTIKDIKIIVSTNEINVLLYSDKNADYEVAAVRRISQRFYKTFDKKINYQLILNH